MIATPRRIAARAWFVLLAGGAFLGAVQQTRAALTTLDDIQYWVGAGQNRAALVVDWDAASAADTSLAWGFRWDGTATGEDMIRAIVADDPRLFAKVDGYSGTLGLALYGFGYDDGDGDFALDDGTFFDAAGLAEVAGPADGGSAVDSDDRYAEGWFDGYWNYSVSSGQPFAGESWSYSQVGMSSRVLVDGGWDGWAYTATFSPAAFARNPVAAQQTLTADFTVDGRVDGHDFLIWQRGTGLGAGASRASGDATGDGAVNDADLHAWVNQFGKSGHSSLNAPSTSGETILTDFTKPVDPAFEAAGKTEAQINAGYAGSGGGTGVDLSLVGLDWIQYVRVSQPLGALWSTEIDAFADVGVAPEPSTVALAAVATWRLVRRRPRA